MTRIDINEKKGLINFNITNYIKIINKGPIVRCFLGVRPKIKTEQIDLDLEFENISEAITYFKKESNMIRINDYFINPNKIVYFTEMDKGDKTTLCRFHFLEVEPIDIRIENDKLFQLIHNTLR